MAWGMIDITREEITLTPAEDNSWYKFMNKSIELDGTKYPHGYHWFWGIYYLHEKISAFPKFNLNHIQKEFPSDHWINNIDDRPKADGGAPDILTKTDAVNHLHNFLQEPRFVEKITEIDFSKLIFPVQADFSNLIFPIAVSFKYSNFHSGRFYSAHFFGSTCFAKAIFHQSNVLNGNFPSHTTFQGATFYHWVDFNDAQLKEKFVFTGTRFIQDASFKKATFSENAYFDDVTFSETVDFKNAVFCGETARFADTTFEKTTDFTDAKFKGYANFKNSKLKGRTSFQRAQFELHAPRFYNATFNDEMTFSGMKPSKLKQDDVDNYPDFNRKKDKIADASEIHENYRKRIEENQTSYENTSTKLGNQKKYHDEHLFFRNEMYCRQQLEKRWLAWFSYFLYQILSDYGYAMGRALGLWLAHMLIWAGILFIWGFKSGCNTYERIACSLITSASNAHSFLLSKSERLENCYAMANNESTFNLFWAGETILGVLFLFLLLTTLRVRFRFSGITLGNTK